MPIIAPTAPKNFTCCFTASLKNLPGTAFIARRVPGDHPGGASASECDDWDGVVRCKLLSNRVSSDTLDVGDRLSCT